MNPDESHIARIVALARQLSDSAGEQITSALTEGRMLLMDGALSLQRIVQVSTSSISEIIRVMRDWDKHGGDAQSFALILRAARIANRQNAAVSPRVQLAWTGPIDPAVQVRSTKHVLEELIEGAQREIIIVGYSITEGAASIFTRLISARQRQVEVIILANQLEQRIETIRSLWPSSIAAPMLFSRPLYANDPQAALHAKVTLVDRQRMLVTSANLTYHGLAGNIEIGVLVEGSAAEDTARLIQRLIVTGEVQSIKLRD